MDQELLHHARLAMLMLQEQMQPEAVPDTGKVVRALIKLAACGRAIEEEQLSPDAATEALKSVFRGSRPEEKEV